jgi:hypothetical protein
MTTSISTKVKPFLLVHFFSCLSVIIISQGKLN